MNKDYTLPHETNDVEQPYNRQLLIFFCLFCFVSVENFSLMKTSTWPAKSCKYFDLCSALMDIEQSEFVNVPRLMIHGASVYKDHLWQPVRLTPIAQRLAADSDYLSLRLRFVAAKFRIPNLPHSGRTLLLTAPPLPNNFH